MLLHLPLKLGISGFCLLLQTACFVWAGTDIIQYELTNGLKVVIEEDHRSPIVEVQMWYKVASVDEPAGMTGVSHALEHMMFRGSKQTAPGEFDRILNDLGATNNAFTSQDFTVYFNSMISNRLPVILALEAERMRGLTLSEEVFKSEHLVILEEWRTSDVDSPHEVADNHFRAMAFPVSPYRLPILGWPDDIKSLNGKKLRSWYDQWYHPNNATLVIVGDVSPEQVKVQIDQYFKAIPSAKLPERTNLSDIDAPGERKITIQHPQTSTPGFMMGFNVPALTPNSDDWEPYALRMLAGVLSEGDSSRLESEIIREKQLASDLYAYYTPHSRGNKLFSIAGAPNSAKNMSSEQVVSAVWSTIEDIKKVPPSLSELARVSAQLKASKVFESDDLSRRAFAYGHFVSLGFPAGWKDTYYQRLDSVTPQQIQQVAQKYLIPVRLTTAYLIPEKGVSHHE